MEYEQGVLIMVLLRILTIFPRT